MLKLSRSAYRYQAKKLDDGELKSVLLELATRKPRWGIRKMVDHPKIRAMLGTTNVFGECTVNWA
jgi:hypothetical protein